MIFNATKDTYSMYSCTISGMSREMMKMDGRDSAEYQIWEMRDIWSFLEKFKSLQDKLVNMVVFPTQTKRAKRDFGPVAAEFFVLEREA